jgi:hypothetical protein
MPFVSSHWRVTKNGDPHYITSYIYLLIFTKSLWLNVKHFIALTKRESVRRIFFFVITDQNYPCQHIDQYRYNPRMDYAFCLLTLKSSEKWRSPLFGATCNFNDQILPYGILFLALSKVFWKFKIWSCIFWHEWIVSVQTILYFFLLKENAMVSSHWRVLKNGDPHYLVLHAT